MIKVLLVRIGIINLRILKLNEKFKFLNYSRPLDFYRIILLF